MATVTTLRSGFASPGVTALRRSESGAEVSRDAALRGRTTSACGAGTVRTEETMKDVVPLHL